METHELAYTYTTLLMQIIGHKLKNAMCKDCSPWNRVLLANIKKAEGLD